MLKKALPFILIAPLMMNPAMAEENTPAEAPAQEETEATPIGLPEISEQQFQLERQSMIEDLTEKISVMGTARDCAEKSETADALRQCIAEFNRIILEKIRAKQAQ